MLQFRALLALLLNKISGTSSDDPVGDFVQKVRLGSLNFGEGYLARGGAAIAGAAGRALLFGGEQVLDSPGASAEAARRVIEYGKVPVYLFAAYVEVYGEQAWKEFDDLLGVDRRLRDYNITSEQFTGGDTTRTVIKGGIRFLVDYFIVDANKHEAQPYRFTVIVLREGMAGGLEWAKALGISSFKGKAVMGAVSLISNYALLLTNPLLGVPLGLMGYFGGPKAQKIATGLSALYWVTMLLGAIGIGFTGVGTVGLLVLGVGAAGFAGLRVLLYIRQNYPDKWEALCNLLPSFAATDKLLPDDSLDQMKFVQRDDYDPAFDISRLYGLKNYKALEESEQMIRVQVEYGLFIVSATARIAIFNLN